MFLRCRYAAERVPVRMMPFAAKLSVDEDSPRTLHCSVTKMAVTVGSSSASQGRFEFGKHHQAMLYAAIGAWLIVEGPGRRVHPYRAGHTSNRRKTELVAFLTARGAGDEFIREDFPRTGGE
jgi:hypothetical protein